MELFIQTLERCGVDLVLEDVPVSLTREPSLIARDLEKLLQGNNDSQEANLQKFISGFKKLCSKTSYFRKALLYTNFKKNGENNLTGTIEQQSLIRILLMVDCIQTDVINVLMDEVTNVASEEEQDTSWLRLLLLPLRYLTFISKPEALTTKLLDILDVGTYAAQLEILDSLTEIVPDNQSYKLSKHLCKLLGSNDLLAPAIIDCLSTLPLENDARVEVSDKILAKIVTGTCVKMLPNLIEFLLSDHKTMSSIDVVQKIRNALDVIMTTSCNSETESVQVLIFTKLQTYAARSKIVTEAWLNMITSIKNDTDHKPIDLLILFMLHSTVKQKKAVIEGIVKKRVKDGLFSPILLEKMFEQCINEQLLINYFQSICETGCHLIRTMHEPKITYFCIILFKTLFNHRYTSPILRKELLDCLILLIGSNDHKNDKTILSIFSDLLQNISKIQPHTLLLMKLLEQIDSLDVTSVKEVFEILCALTCGEADHDMSGLRDEIHMVIRKQLSNSKKILKHRGVITSVVMAKHLAKTEEMQSETIVEEDCIPNENVKDAVSLLELTSLFTSGYTELMGLYYDQLAYMLTTTKNLNKHFISWLNETVTNEFQNGFVTENIMQSSNGLNFSMQYSLNSQEEMETPIAVNIAELTVRPENVETRYITVLAPHFRLLRLLHFHQQNGDLSSIDALLGCAVVMPELNDIETLDFTQTKLVANCLFFCINWFREVISGFVTQKSKKIRTKVVNRLLHIIDLQKKLNLCMDSIPEHQLPNSYFDTWSLNAKEGGTCFRKEKRTKKKIKSVEPIQNCNVTSTTSINKKHRVTSHNEISYREMDTDILILLKYHLKKDNAENSQSPVPQTQVILIDMEQLEFILKDFVGKLSFLSDNKNLGPSHMNMVIANDIITDCRAILSNINKHIATICERFDPILDAVKERSDTADLFCPKAVLLKSCFGLIIESYCLIFSWSGFQLSKNHGLLRQLLLSVVSSQVSQSNSANKLIVEFINKLSTYVPYCIHMKYAINLVQTMQSLYKWISNDNDHVQKKIITVCGILLSKKWYNYTGRLESGKVYSGNLEILIRIYLNGASIKTLSGLIGTLLEQVPDISSKGYLPMLQSVDTANFYILFRGLCNALQNRTKFEIQALTNKEHLIMWQTVALSMQGLTAIVKIQESKSNLVCFLKKSIDILKVFLSHGVPILEIMLKSKPDDVVEIFKTIQTSTRFLHHLCCYSKLKKESSLMAYVPQFRLLLETLVYRVKAALVANNCSAAFWMGNLRNRDLQGEDIISQTSTLSTNLENENSDEELPDDENEDILNGNISRDKSESMDYA